MAEQKFRLITRADFDGVVCGALFGELGMIDDIVFAEPNDMQQGRVPVSDKDISANLPYVEGIHQCFDHHRSEVKRVGSKDNLIIDADAPSAARVVYRHFGGKDGFPEISGDLLEAVDQADSAQYSAEDILAPEKWTLLNFIVDPRTGLERVLGFNLAHTAFLYDLMTYCRHTPIDEILQLPDVHERVNAYMYQREFAELQLIRCTTEHDKLVVIDLREEDPIYVCGRFLIYALYPGCSVSLHLLPGPGEGVTSIAIGKSILDRSSKTNIGAMLLEYGGGGHDAAGGCRVENDKVDEVLAELIRRINTDG
jgi:nanoRNase/pAp phosphatase (c-di-AMP/oligoRNAs hydrolase)